MTQLKCLHFGDWFFACASWHHGIWSMRIRSHALVLKAPWNAALFSERNRFQTSVLPLGGGWRVLLRSRV